ncbi:MAG TPA: hypothetical protein VGG30_01675, partial [Pirellulales bacterium]
SAATSKSGRARRWRIDHSRRCSTDSGYPSVLRNPMTAPRRRWSFSLRTLFVVVTVAACWLGWEENIVRQRAQFYAWVVDNGGFDFYEGFAPGTTRIPIPELSAIRRLLGDKPRAYLVLPIGTHPEREKMAKSLFPEAKVEVDRKID